MFGKVIEGCSDGLENLAIWRLQKQLNQTVLMVARDFQQMHTLADNAAFFYPDYRVLVLPPWDIHPYDRISPSQANMAERIATLCVLYDVRVNPRGVKTLVITCPQALMQKLVPPSYFAQSILKLKSGNIFDISALENYFKVYGFQKRSLVSERGDFAIRGGIIDIFPTGEDDPIRFDFFGDTLESIRIFDAQTQRTLRQLPEITLQPVSEIEMSEQTISAFRQNYRQKFGLGKDDVFYESVTSGIRRQGIESLLPLFYNGLSTIFDHLPRGASFIWAPHALSASQSFFDSVKDSYTTRLERASGSDRPIILPPDALYIEPDLLSVMVATNEQGHQYFSLKDQSSDDPNALSLQGKRGQEFSAERKIDSVNLFESVVAYAKNRAAQGQWVLFAASSEGASERLSHMLSEHGLDGLRLAQTLDDAFNFGVKGTRAKPLQRCVLSLEHGFETPELTIISEADILGERLARIRKTRRASNFITESSALSEGDLVVHIDHGIGRFAGLKVIDVSGAPHDCLELNYAEQSKLYLPVENIDLLTRYGADNDDATLDRLGSAQWQARKAKAKSRLRDMAEGLIKLAAARLMKQGPLVDAPSGLFDEFCAQFPYEETEDQLRAIEDVLSDFEKGTPMDRLICGDVGFGKTEVALRAAFVTAMSGKQVALICPTTLLARQHFKTFSERFVGWPIKVRQLSRLVSRSDMADTKDALKSGEVEIVIGTHALLSEQIGFKELGLIIIDEEQHFGVKHKERLKAYRADVHVLSMSATPIPRTLQMALSGIRELSIIATPPMDRLAIRTYCLPFDPIAIREALLREKYRGGQAYYVVPRIKDLDKITEFLREYVPEIRFIVGHGQLSATQLEEVMTAFYEGRYDLLLSTTIVESGLDVPTANTMIVHRADQFGLAQLYQIRGRVGRSKTRAFAYLTTEAGKALTSSAERRLQLLQSLDSLGAGFQLASHDLDLRGGGNLLGDEQSGHIREVGVELYQQMLEDAVNALKDTPELEQQTCDWSPQINLGVAVLIPESYIADMNLRISLYRRLSDAEDKDTREALGVELIDRFGSLPEEVDQLLKIITIKSLARKANVEKIDMGPKGCVITFRNNIFNNPLGLVKWLQEKAPIWALRPDQKLLIRGEWNSAAEKLKNAEVILSKLVLLAEN